MEQKSIATTNALEESSADRSPSRAQSLNSLPRISPQKVLDEVYDVYLVELPLNFQKALDIIQDTKAKILEKYFPDLTNDFAYDFENQVELESFSEQELEKADQQLNPFLDQQIKVVEKYIDACLMERFISEELHIFFNAVFTRTAFVNQSQILKKFSFEHLPYLEANIYSIVKQELMKLKKENSLFIVPDEVGLPAFFIDYYLGKCKGLIRDWYDEFLLNFVTPFESQWLDYVTASYETYLKDQTLPEILNIELLQITFDILCRLQIPGQIKNEIEHVKSKIFCFSIFNDLDLDEDAQFTGVRVQQKLEFNSILKKNFSDNEKPGAIYAILFRIFFYMVNENYTALDREILKQFIEAFQSILVEFILNSYEYSPSFYLTVVEKVIAKEDASVSQIDLKELAFSKRYQWFIKRFKIDQVLVFSSVLNLQKISSDSMRSKHIVIAISGFLTEDIDKSECWRQVVSHFKDSEVYALEWNSLSVKNFLYEGHMKYKSGRKRVVSVLKFINTGKKQFRYSSNQAKAAGTILAIFLIKDSFSENKCVSILGFSLGTVIALECVKALSKFYTAGNLRAGRILSDIYLMGGAAVLSEKKKDIENLKEWNQFCQIINGRLSNVYSKADMVLRYMFSFISNLKPVGLAPIFEEEQFQLAKAKKAFNYDCTFEAPGHMTYMEVQDKLLEKIPHAY